MGRKDDDGDTVEEQEEKGEDEEVEKEHIKKASHLPWLPPVPSLLL
jgi:hypothetical protein